MCLPTYSPNLCAVLYLLLLSYSTSSISLPPPLPIKGCIGYLGHPFKKRLLGLSIAYSFSLSGGTQPSIEAGNGSRTEEKTGCMGSKPSGKACKSSMRGLPKTSSAMSYQLDGPGPPAGCSHMWSNFRQPIDSHSAVLP